MRRVTVVMIAFDFGMATAANLGHAGTNAARLLVATAASVLIVRDLLDTRRAR